MTTLSREERALRSAVERGEWKSAALPASTAGQRYVEHARQALRKNRRINIRLSQYDLEALQGKAIQEGMPYQTLVTSVLHKYVTGQLKVA